MNDRKTDIGAAVVDKDRVTFRVWAPKAERLSVKILSGGGEYILPLKKDEKDYFEGTAEGIRSGDRYMYRLNDTSEFPDPASRFQPEGVHAPSQVVDPADFQWDDDGWKGTPLAEFMIYELHVGTFTKEGTFEAIIPFLDYLKELGITAVELMPVSQFPGHRNWGYDGVYPFAVQNSYGGPEGLKALINACHGKGLAVVLDVVYNHLGPEGNYLNKFGHYFTDRYRTPWGDAVNFDGSYSDGVRHFFISNALYWVTEYHIDALRIDAIHGIFDFSARHFLHELAGTVHKQAEALGRKIYVIAESGLNDVRVINSAPIGGYDLDAQWNDDFHHCLHTLLTGEGRGYYEDFGTIQQLEKAFREGFVYSGEYSLYRKRRHGSSTKNIPADKLIVFSQNHDQVGNRAAGDRLGQTQSFEKLKLAAGVVILSPFIPLLFMGEEYGETAPFQYFVSHSDKALIEAVRKGREEEFATFQWEGEVPDPQAEGTFLNSKIDIAQHKAGRHNVLFRFYKELIRLRKEVPALSHLSKDNMEVMGFEKERALLVRRWFGGDKVFMLCNLSSGPVSVEIEIPEGVWEKLLDSHKYENNLKQEGQTLTARNNKVRTSLRAYGFVLYRKAKGK
jgi:maltooligosyltrehalose trehalohydrolase